MSHWHPGRSSRGTGWQEGDAGERSTAGWVCPRWKEKQPFTIKFGVKMACSPAAGRGEGLEQVAGVRCFPVGCFIWILTGSPGQSPSLPACALLVPYRGGASQGSLGLCCSSKAFLKKILQIFEILKALEFTGIVLY